VEEETSQIIMEKPHVVILGAGASRAAALDGDVDGRIVPLMNDLIEIVELDKILIKWDISFEEKNFESIYSRIHEDESKRDLLVEIEKSIESYFDILELPYHPTIYDHLVLSMREKDLIATFNWDPFLLQAYARNSGKFDLPQLAFLHGNVKTGFCNKDRILGIKGNICSKCGEYFTPTRLLHPVEHKDYYNDKFIADEWRRLKAALRSAFMITFFGYGAPKYDKGALELMKMAWGEAIKRNMEQIEIIDIKDKDKLYDTWEPFIHTHHYEAIDNFYKSWIARHPRRSGEAYFNQFFDVKCIEDNPIPPDIHFKELWEWLLPLKNVEDKYKKGNK